MKEMRQYRRTLTLAFTLLIAVNTGLSVTPLSAESGLKRGEWEIWEGTQFYMPVQVEIHKLRIAGRNVEICGAIVMGTLDGYEFDGTSVGYEIIHYMKIYGLDDDALELLKYALGQCADMAELFSNPDYMKLVGMLYSYPRFGRFTWHTESGDLVGRGIFRGAGGAGRLWVSGSSFVAKGTFYPEPDSPVGPVLVHTGWYIATD